jgi:hypothetical protein
VFGIPCNCVAWEQIVDMERGELQWGVEEIVEEEDEDESNKESG